MSKEEILAMARRAMAREERRLVLEDGSMHPQPGRLLFSDLSVDPSTGQITLRAEVPNPRGQLLPGKRAG